VLLLSHLLNPLLSRIGISRLSFALELLTARWLDAAPPTSVCMGIGLLEAALELARIRYKRNYGQRLARAGLIRIIRVGAVVFT
jgi:hypothetical protein